VLLLLQLCECYYYNYFLMFIYIPVLSFINSLLCQVTAGNDISQVTYFGVDRGVRTILGQDGWVRVRVKTAGLGLGSRQLG